MIKWTPEKIAYIEAQRAAGRKMKDIAEETGYTEAAIYNALRERRRDKAQPEDIFSYDNVREITGIPVKTVQSLIEMNKLKGNGTVERRDLINFVLRYPGSCEKANPIQIIYLLGGDKCSPNLR
jgi:mannitol-1-phosphate/altronate dehydrogenase